MLKKYLRLFLPLLLIGIVLPGCHIESNKQPSSGAVKVFPVKAAGLISPGFNQDEASRLVAAGANDFAFRLSSALLEHADGENFVCSPFSVWLPLAALANAADAESLPALLDAIGAAGFEAGDVNKAASRMLYDLTREMDKEYYKDAFSPLCIANAVFVDDDVTLSKNFAQNFADYFLGASMNVDFRSPEAPKTVNRWASDNTGGLIEDIVQEFDPDTVAAIANAVYFSDRWSWEFSPDSTVADIFHSPSGDTEARFMIREGDMQTYYEDDKVQAMPLNFSTGGGMMIILPKDGDAGALLSGMTTDYFNEIREDSITATGKLLLPRFTIDSGVMPLKDALTELGVPLFDEDAAPLTGGLIEEDLPVWLSAALQKAYIEVDEKGTTAAAVTLMRAAAGAAMPKPTEPFEMKCDKPFVFVLYGRTYDGGDQILFTGVVNRPD
ncbi:MAG: hypothetical protein LBS19_04645 [Clostridiales bacterium]|jgi:serpin B|nr:hypothetical protein [Clostridiales bacterium]